MKPDPLFIERAKHHHQRIAGIERQVSLLSSSRLRDQLLAAQHRLLDGMVDDNPCLPYPPGTFDGPIGLGFDQRTSTALGVAATTLSTHTIIQGTTGSGKTSAAAHITANIARANPDVKISYLDPKGDYRRRALDDRRCIIITPDLPLNILRPPSFLTKEDYHALLLDVFGRSHWAGQQQLGVLKEALQAAYEHHPDPNIEDIVTCLQPMLSVKHTYQQRDAARGVINKLGDIKRLLPGTHWAKGSCLSMEDLANAPSYCRLVPGNTYEFVFTLRLLVHHARNQALMIRNTLEDIVVIDESLQILSEHTAHMEGTPLLDQAISTMREMGIGLIITTSSWRHISAHVRNNANIQIAMLTTDGWEAEEVRRSLQLTQSEFSRFQQLRPLECFVRVPAHWPYAVLASVPVFPAHEKLVDETEFQCIAKEPYQALLPPPPLAPMITTTPPPATPPPGAPVALGEAQAKLLQAIDQLQMPMSTEAYAAAGLSLQAGDRAAKHLESIDLLARNPVVARNGRGGKAIALQLTNAGYERLGKKPPHGLRGGSSPQHTYIVTNLARQIPGAHIEQRLGEKSIDLVFRANPALIALIDRLAECLCTTPAQVMTGDLIALEVEASFDDTDATKTSVRNATADLAAGATTVILATMKTTREAVSDEFLRQLPSSLHSRIWVTDALDLLCALKERAR